MITYASLFSGCGGADIGLCAAGLKPLWFCEIAEKPSDVRQWMNGKDLPDPITIRQVIDMTSEDYGGREFAEFFEVGR